MFLICITLYKHTLCKICQYTGFLWPVFSHIRSESTILTLYEKIWVRKNPYAGKFYTVVIGRLRQSVGKKLVCSVIFKRSIQFGFPLVKTVSHLGIIDSLIEIHFLMKKHISIFAIFISNNFLDNQSFQSSWLNFMLHMLSKLWW